LNTACRRSIHHTERKPAEKESARAVQELRPARRGFLDLRDPVIQLEEKGICRSLVPGGVPLSGGTRFSDCVRMELDPSGV